MSEQYVAGRCASFLAMIWGLLAGVALLWLLHRNGRKRKVTGLPETTKTVAPFEEPVLDDKPPSEGIKVVCVAVAPARQDWRSLVTGRRYDVLSLNGVLGAQPGDKGLAVMTKRGWRVTALRGDGVTESSEK